MNTKRCPACDSTKPISAFGPRKGKGDGYQGYCRECSCAKAKSNREANLERHKASTKAWREANKERFAAMNRDWHIANRERRKAYRRAKYAENRDRELAVAREWKASNHEKCVAMTMKRMAAKKRAIPSWMDKEKVESFYMLSDLLTEETGVQHHVDHVVPLQSKVVCGLHWHGNLQVITNVENHRKKNVYWPDMPEQRAA